MRSTATITVSSHGFRVTDFNSEFAGHLSQFCRRYIKHKIESKVLNGRRTLVKIPDRVFAAATKNRSELRFHINCFEEFKNHMRNCGYNTSRFKIVELEVPEGRDVKFDFTSPDIGPREHQVDWLKYQLDLDPNKVNTKVNTLQTGKGKTFCAIYQMVKMQKLTVITLMPKYINTWMVGLDDFVKLVPEDIMIVQGSVELNALMKSAEQGNVTAKIIIISLPTFQYFMSEYEDNSGVMTHYDYTPDQFWEVVQPGLLIVDEGHESIHALFRYDLYCNVRNKVVLSATLDADDPFINEMYIVIYPKAIRFKGGEYDKYIEAVALMYGLESTKKVKYGGFGGTYSHVKFEQSILKDKKLLDEYMRFIAGVVDYFYLKVREPDQRALIYCATVDMCIQVAAYLTVKHRGIGLDVRKYTQEDPKSTLYEAEVTVSTLMSAGTGVDIPGLRTGIMTVAVGSKQKSSQALGRLRRLKDYPDTTPTFVYFVCANIKQHMDYHRKKLENFEDKTLSQRTMNSGFSL